MAKAMSESEKILLNGCEAHDIEHKVGRVKNGAAVFNGKV